MGSGGHGLHEGRSESRIEHGGFIDDEKIGREGGGFVGDETAFGCVVF